MSPTPRSDLDQAIANYIANPSAEALQHVRELIDNPLTDRLLHIVNDREKVATAIRNSIQIFATLAVGSQYSPGAWKAWITAYGITLLLGRECEKPWIDKLASRTPQASTLDRRMVIVRLILTLDSACEYNLLDWITESELPSALDRCRKLLEEKLQMFLLDP